MTHVVTESCIKCRCWDYVLFCPVDCFRECGNFLDIDPDECIDCTLCVSECPVEAIFMEDDVPANQSHLIVLNADPAKAWPVIADEKAFGGCGEMGNGAKSEANCICSSAEEDWCLLQPTRKSTHYISVADTVKITTASAGAYKAQSFWFMSAEDS